MFAVFSKSCRRRARADNLPPSSSPGKDAATLPPFRAGSASAKPLPFEIAFDRKPSVRITDFSVSRLPRIEFGAGTLARLPAIARSYGTHALLVTGAGSLKSSPFWPALTEGLKAQKTSWLHFAVPGEPSPQMVDEAVRALRTERIDMVIGRAVPAPRPRDGPLPNCRVLATPQSPWPHRVRCRHPIPPPVSRRGKIS